MSVFGLADFEHFAQFEQLRSELVAQRADERRIRFDRQHLTSERQKRLRQSPEAGADLEHATRRSLAHVLRHPVAQSSIREKILPQGTPRLLMPIDFAASADASRNTATNWNSISSPHRLVTAWAGQVRPYACQVKRKRL